MKNGILNWGLLSTAHINEAVIPILHASKRNRLQAVASRQTTTAQRYAKEHEISRAHGSYEALLEDREIDVVYNSLPNHLHAEWSIKALQHGKHVLCEKPLGLTVAEVDAMAEAAAKAGRVLAEAFMYRHHAQTLRVQELVQGGAVGNPQIINGTFTFTIGRSDDIRLTPETGGGSVWDVGCYPISFARMIAASEPVEVFGWQTPGESGVDEFFQGMLRFDNGVRAGFDCGFRSPYRSWMEIVGDQGVLTIGHAFKPGRRETITLQKKEARQEIQVNGNELYEGEIEDMADSILEGKPSRVTLTDSRANVATMVALLDSARQGQPVKIPQ
jgi:D-xylose 1-dehydrogenase (NADP+, D-xylono-1,5-lactone-forming)